MGTTAWPWSSGAPPSDPHSTVMGEGRLTPSGEATGLQTRGPEPLPPGGLLDGREGTWSPLSQKESKGHCFPAASDGAPRGARRKPWHRGAALFPPGTPSGLGSHPVGPQDLPVWASPASESPEPPQPLQGVVPSISIALRGAGWNADPRARRKPSGGPWNLCRSFSRVPWGFREVVQVSEPLAQKAGCRRPGRGTQCS